ncbi:GEVED domain-containing protein [Larkinella sp. GY13]|uniref:GEVED domain-containing protein n=1 Tax=Larkinella sp. GY13 TaxID=3453720 RepID=UPI003EEA0A4C
MNLKIIAGEEKEKGRTRPLFYHLFGTILVILGMVAPAVANTYVVTNTNATGAGSFHQALLDANANPGADVVQFNIPPALLDANNVAKITMPTGILISGSVFIDGKSQAINSGRSNTACLNSEAITVGVDNVAIPAFDCPEVEVTFPSVTTLGFFINTGADGTVMDNIAVVGPNSSPTNGTLAEVEPGVSNIKITNCFLGPTATGIFSGNSLATTGSILQILGSNVEVSHNIVGYNLNGGGIILNGLGVNNNTIKQNKIIQAGITSTVGDAITLVNHPNYNLIEGNYIFKPGANGMHLLQGASNNTIRNNTIIGAGQLVQETAGIAVNQFVSFGGPATFNNQITKNVITASGGPAILVANGNGNLISQNSTFNNGTLGIDLTDETTANTRDQGNGVTINNGVTTTGLGNIGYDFPIISSATINSNGDLVVTGFARPAAKIELFAADNTADGGSLSFKYGEGEHFFYSFQEGSAGIDLDATTGSYSVADGNTDANASRFQVIIPQNALPAFVNNTLKIAATATDALNNTSEFGPAFTLNLTRDYGDLPAIYCTEQTSNGASHLITAGLKMGALIDGNTDGIPAATGAIPDGDDTNGDGFVAYEYYNGIVGSTANIPASGATATGLVSSFGVVPANQGDPNMYGIRFSGYITIKDAGTYTFYTNSDDGSILKIDGITVVNNDFAQIPTERSGTITLSPGNHQIEVLYWQGNDFSALLTVSYAGPNITKQLIPSSVLSSVAPDDEDGVASFPTLTTSTVNYTVPVTVQNTTGGPANLIGWIDFNRNGTFDTGEASAITNVPTGTNGTVNVSWSGLSGLNADPVYARFRLSSDPAFTAASSCGPLNNGEVEDYQLTIVCTPASITASQNSLTICSGQQANVTFTTTPVGSPVRWTGSDGTAGFSSTMVTAPVNNGLTPILVSYTAVTGEFGCTSSTVVTVTVNPVPVITPSVCSQTICSGQTGAITFTSSVSATVNWLRVEDGATGTGNISQLFATTGTNTYKIWGVSAAPASCPSSTTITCVIVVNQCTDPCSLTVTASASQTAVCVGQVVTLASTVTGNLGAVTYAWSGPNGFTSNAANPTLPAATTAMTGIYTVTVSDPTSSTSCIRTASVAVNVGSLYVAASSNSPVCTTGSLSLTGIAAGGNGSFTYAWSGPNGFVSAVQNPTLALSTTAQSGNYNLLVTDTQGCSGTATTSVVVATQPNLSVSGAPGLTVCSGVSTTLNVTGDSGATVTWTNSVGQSGTGTAINFTGLINVSGLPQSVTFVVTAATGACVDQEFVVVTVNPAPALQVTPISAVYCNLEQVTVTATASITAATINWTRTPNTPNPPVPSGSGTGAVTVQQTLPVGAYTYQFTAVGTNGCSSQTASVPVTVQQ